MALRSPSGPTHRWALARIVLVGSLALLPLGAQAQDEEVDPTESLEESAAEAPASANPVVRAMLVEAVAEYEAEHYAESQALFRRAHELAPSARTLRGLGMASFEMRSYVAALHALEGALSATERPLTDTQRAHVEELLARARGFVGTLRLHVEPDGASIRIDGATAQPEPDGTLLLDPGTHVIAIDHAAYRPQTIEVHVEPGVSQERTLVLAAVTSEPPIATRTDDGLWWGGAGLGIAAAVGLVAAGTMGAIALADRDQLRTSCAVYVCAETLRPTRDRARDLSVAADVVGTIAATLGTAAVVMLIVAATTSPARAPDVEAGAACTSDGCTASMRGAF